MILLVLPLGAQLPGTDPGITPRDRYQGMNEPNSSMDARMEAKRRALLNDLRQKSMVSDADRLLHLAQELQDDANSGGTRLTAVERMRAAAEIEKLAKNVRDKMIYAIGESPQFAAPFSVFQR